jgi:hypothetical protein
MWITTSGILFQNTETPQRFAKYQVINFISNKNTNKMQRPSLFDEKAVRGFVCTVETMRPYGLGLDQDGLSVGARKAIRALSYTRASDVKYLTCESMTIEEGPDVHALATSVQETTTPKYKPVFYPGSSGVRVRGLDFRFEGLFPLDAETELFRRGEHLKAMLIEGNGVDIRALCNELEWWLHQGAKPEIRIPVRWHCWCLAGPPSSGMSFFPPTRRCFCGKC